VLLLAALLPGAWAVAAPALDDHEWLGLSERTWLFLALAVPIVQQALVVLLWRAGHSEVKGRVSFAPHAT